MNALKTSSIHLISHEFNPLKSCFFEKNLVFILSALALCFFCHGASKFEIRSGKRNRFRRTNGAAARLCQHCHHRSKQEHPHREYFG